MFFVVFAAAASMTSLPPVGFQMTPGTITIVAAGDQNTGDRVAAIFVDAAEHAVLRTSFLPLPNPSHSRYIATIEVSQTPRGVVATRDRASVDLPKMKYGGGGLSLTLPSNKGQLHGLILTRLTVKVSLRGDDRVVWSGQAVTIRVADTRNGEISVVAATLADALFSRFPNHMSEPISVP